MRHHIDGNRLGRNSSLRQATVRDIAKATLVHQRVRTTKAKAKEARRLVEKLITLGKRADLASKRRAFAILCDHYLVSDLFNKTAVRFKSRLGGYTRIIPLSQRRGDNAHLVYLELTEKEIIVPAAKPKAPKQEKLQPQEGMLPKQEKPLAKEDKSSKPTAPKPAKKMVEEVKKDVPVKPKREIAPPVEGPSPKDKSKPTKSVFGGIKNIFQRKPPPAK